MLLVQEQQALFSQDYFCPGILYRGIITFLMPEQYKGERFGSFNCYTLMRIGYIIPILQGSNRDGLNRVLSHPGYKTRNGMQVNTSYGLCYDAVTNNRGSVA